MPYLGSHTAELNYRAFSRGRSRDASKCYTKITKLKIAVKFISPLNTSFLLITL